MSIKNARLITASADSSLWSY